MNIQRTIDRCILAICNDIWDNIEDNKYGLYNGLYGKILVLIYYNMYNAAAGRLPARRDDRDRVQHDGASL